MLLTLANCVTDNGRRAARAPWPLTQQGGGQADEYAPNDASIGVWNARTNLFGNGQCDGGLGTTWLIGGVGSVSALDPSVPGRFSPQSVKYTTDGGSANQACVATTAAGLAAAAGNYGSTGIWFIGVAGASYRVNAEWLNTDASVTTGTVTTFTATGLLQYLEPAPLAVAVGKTGDRLRVRVFINGTRAESFWCSNPMLVNVGAARAAPPGPYIPTRGGATASVLASTATGPSSLLSGAQGWWATYVRLPYASSALNVNSGPPVFLDWSTAIGADRIALTANGTHVRSQYVDGATVLDSLQAHGGWAAGASMLFAGRWTAAVVGVSYNGAAWSDIVNTVPGGSTPASAVFGIGNGLSAIYGSSEIMGDVRWAGVGTGTVDDAWVAALQAQLVAGYRPWPSQLGAAAACTATLRFRNDGTAVMLPEDYQIEGRAPHGRYRRQPRLMR